MKNKPEQLIFDSVDDFIEFLRKRDKYNVLSRSAVNFQTPLETIRDILEIELYTEPVQ